MAYNKHTIVSRESSSAKVYHIIAILITTILAIIILSTQHARYTGSALSLVQRDRTNVQIIVQIVSYTAAFLQLYTLRKLFSFSFRLHVRKATMSLEKLSLCAAIANSQVDLNLTLKNLLICLLIAFVAIIPGALWTGALTPVLVSKEREVGDIEIPRFTESSTTVWNSEFEIRQPNMSLWNLVNNCQQVQDQRGFVPSCPVPALQPLLLLSARTATPMDGSPRLHAKFDNSEWTYIGRSYGVGSSVALASPQLSQRAIVNGTGKYHYLEDGYLSNVTCIKNSTSAFAIHLEDTGVGADPIAVYSASGTLPNEPPGVSEFFPIVSWHDDYSELLAWAARSINGRNSIAIASGRQNYTNLNQTQCEVTFTPTTFNISVDLVVKTIRVSAVPEVLASDIDPTGNLTANVIHSLNLLSRMSGTLYDPILGEALSVNTINMARFLSHQDPSSGNTDSEVTNTTITTRAVAASFTAMIDDILVAFGASQIINARDTIPSSATGILTAVRVGESPYIVIVFCLNAVILIAVLLEAVRTRYYIQLTKFDPFDIKSALVSASAGGGELAKMLNKWDGDARHAGLRSLRVRVEGEKEGEMFAIKGVEGVETLDANTMALQRTHRQQERFKTGWGRPGFERVPSRGDATDAESADGSSW